MITFKCKMCGGDLNFEVGASVATCPYCGTMQTLPKLSDSRRANMYERANHYRRLNEYDKALEIYEQILHDDATDAEVYWSLVLCQFGIEYVEDPSSHKRIPTVNRTQLYSILVNEDYKSALKYADGKQKKIYEEEAKTIDGIQKGILLISNQEKPFDVFICYKETDYNGRRTPDSVLATDIYHQLTNEGYNVFFSRITLEDKLGYQYEPFIFAALNSARVMLVIGTKPEYFDAVWVKNEWKRYLALMKNDRSRLLIPCYRDMDPYDLPEEFSTLQSQDMSKIGFAQDILHGINKLLSKQTVEGQDKSKNVGINDGQFLDKMCQLLGTQLSIYDSAIKNKKRIISEIEIEIAHNSGFFKKKNRKADEANVNQLLEEIDIISRKSERIKLFQAFIQRNPNDQRKWIDYALDDSIQPKREEKDAKETSIQMVPLAENKKKKAGCLPYLVVIIVGFLVLIAILAIYEGRLDYLRYTH